MHRLTCSFHKISQLDSKDFLITRMPSTRKRSASRRRSRKRANTTTLVILPKRSSRKGSLQRKRSSIKRGKTDVGTVETDVKKALKETQSVKVPKTFKANMEKKIKAEMTEGGADLKTFKAVASIMFKDPEFATMVEKRYGAKLDKAFYVYLRTVGTVLQAVLGTWMAVSEVVWIAMSVTSFVFRIVLWACMLVVKVIDKSGVFPEWLSKRIHKKSKASITVIFN